MARIFVRTASSYICTEGFVGFVQSAVYGHGLNAFAVIQPVTNVTIFQGHHLPSTLTWYSAKRNYKTTFKLSHLTVEEQFIWRLLGANGFGNLTASVLKTFATRLSYLVHIGCRPYELVEYPMILLLTQSEIDKRVEKLRLASKVDKISVGLLKFATPEKSNRVLKQNVANYLRPLGGYMNKVDEIVAELNCSDAKMMEILTRNPRLLGFRYRKDMAEKIRCLIRHGVRHEDLYQNTSLLYNITLATFQSRVERLRKLGWVPLPVGLLGRENNVFEAVVRQKEEQHNFITTESVHDVIRLLPPMSANRTAIVRPKIEYLLSQGYTASDIVNCRQTLRRSLEGIKMAVSELRPYHLQCVDLATINHYALKRRMLSSHRCKFRSPLARVIGCSRSALPPLPNDSSVRAVVDIEGTAVDNANYLRDELGFTAEDLASVPLVLAHSHDVVRRHWNALDSVDGDQDELSCAGRLAKQLFRRYANNRRLRLNLLQYCIEKEANFGHAVVSTWTEDLYDEFGVTEPTSSAAADDSDAELNFDDGDDEGADLLVGRLEAVDDSDANDDDAHPFIV